MFENETNKILSKYSESLKLLKKLHALVDSYEYGQEKYENVFYTVIPRVLNFSSLDYYAHEALTNILKENELAWYLPLRFNKMDELSVKEHAKKINAITPEVFYYSAFYRDVLNKSRYNEKERYIIQNNIYEETKSWEKRLLLILNCIYLLDNPEAITKEQRHKMYNALKDNKTFIFNGCKVTLYNNGRLIIKFSNPELFKRFEDKVNSTIKLLEKDLRGLKYR